MVAISSPIQVLMYSGQLDVIVAAPLTERFLTTVNWTGAAEYKKAPRFHWKVQPGDTEVAGYVRSVGEFYQVSRCERRFNQRDESHSRTPALCKSFSVNNAAIHSSSFFPSRRSSSVGAGTFCLTTNQHAPLT